MEPHVRGDERDTPGPRKEKRRFSMMNVEISTASRRASRRNREAAPVLVSIIRWADSSDVLFEDGAVGTPVFQFQIVHDTKPSVTFGFESFFKVYLTQRNSTIRDLADLERRAFMRLSCALGSRGNDPDEVGVKPWRVAMYASTHRPQEVLEFLEGFINFKSRGKDFAACGVPPMRISAASATHLPNPLPEPWELEPDGAASPHPFDALPMQGRRHLLLQVESVDSHAYDFLFAGNVYLHRNRFEACGVDGGYIGEDDGREYVRCLQGVCFDDAGKRRLTAILGDHCLQGLCVFLINATGSTQDPMVQWLLAKPSVHGRDEA